MLDEPIAVLVVDDDETVRDTIAIGLEAEGMRVFGAADGAEAIELLARHRFDVVVSDIVMPRVDGWMLLMEIRNDPNTSDLPVIILSAKTQELAKILAFKQGAQQYVTKPFSVAELSARVESLARGRRRLEGDAAGAGEAEFRKLAVRKGGRTVLLDVDDVIYFSARNKSTYAHTYENQFLVDMTVSELEERFVRDSFVRVHRSHLVNLDRVREILRVDGAYTVVMADRDETHVPVARRQVKHFREALRI